MGSGGSVSQSGPMKGEAKLPPNWVKISRKVTQLSKTGTGVSRWS